jgi:hypothetical protein
MTTIYTGSNYGIISTLNSGNGSVTNGTSYTSFGWELVTNYTSSSILIDLTSSGTGYLDLELQYSTTNPGIVISSEIYRFLKAPTVPTPVTLQFKPQGKFMKVVLYNNSAVPITFTMQTRFNNSADPDTTNGVISSANSFNRTNVLAPSQIDGTFEDVSDYSLITILTVGTAASIPAKCKIQCIFSTDGTANDREVEYTIQDITANGDIPTPLTNTLTFNPTHTLLPIARYFKIIFRNNVLDINSNLESIPLTTLHITVTYHKNKSKALTSRVTQELTDQADSDTVRAILTGRTIGTKLPQGRYENIGVQNQALATYVREPSTAFGEILTGSLTPQIQLDYSNGEPCEIQSPIYRNDLTNTSFKYEIGLLKISTTGASGTKLIEVTSSQYTKYKPGLGTDTRFTAIFNPNNVAGMTQYIGLFTPENSLTFGYFSDNLDPTKFCIRYGRAGLQQIVDINITGGTSTGNITLNFGGTSITTIGLTTGNTIVQAAYAIHEAINANTSLNTYGWRAIYFRATTLATTYTVRVIRNYASSTQISVTVPTPSGYTIIVPPNIRDGVNTTYQYIPQLEWNIDNCLGQNNQTLQIGYDRNPSGFELDPALGNVYRIVFQYLGFGAITFSIENPETGYFITVHQIKYANTKDISFGPSITSPNFKIGFGIENTSTTPITIAAASLASFLQGISSLSPLYRAYPHIITGNTGGALTISKENARVLFGFRILDTKSSVNSDLSNTVTINRTNIVLNSFSAALNLVPTSSTDRAAANFIFQLDKNPTGFFNGNPISGNVYQPDWTIYDRDNSILVFNGTARTSTSTGIGFTNGTNIFDLPLVENTANTVSLIPLLINVSYDDIYIVSYYGITNAQVASFDTLATISYQINN